jgi:hypothetical protein
VSDRILQFFRTEFFLHWQVDPNDATTIDGTRDGLVRFLRERFGLSAHRAELEADEFLAGINERLRLSRGPQESYDHREKRVPSRVSAA